MTDKIEEMLEELVDAVEEFVYARELGGSAEEKLRVEKARDALRAELAASQAEVERLRGIIRKVEWVGYKDFEHQRHYTCAFCGIKVGNNHSEYCPFYRWEGGAQ